MTVQVGWDTTNEQIDELEKRINNWLSQDEARDISSSTAIMVRFPLMAAWSVWWSGTDVVGLFFLASRSSTLISSGRSS